MGDRRSDWPGLWVFFPRFYIFWTSDSKRGGEVEGGGGVGGVRCGAGKGVKLAYMSVEVSFFMLRL